MLWGITGSARYRSGRKGLAVHTARERFIVDHCLYSIYGKMSVIVLSTNRVITDMMEGVIKLAIP